MIELTATQTIHQTAEEYRQWAPENRHAAKLPELAAACAALDALCQQRRDAYYIIRTVARELNLKEARAAAERALHAFNVEQKAAETLEAEHGMARSCGDEATRPLGTAQDRREVGGSPNAKA